MLTRKETEILRTLAQKYAAIAALPVQDEKRRLWCSLNQVRMQRPMVLIDQIPWEELNTDGTLNCTVADPYWRSVEERLRHTLYQWEHMPADMVADPYICLPRPICDSGWGISICERRIDPTNGGNAASHQYLNQIRSIGDVERIRAPELTLDKALEERLIAEAHSVFDGIIDFRMTGRKFKTGMWDWIAQWMGAENCYIALMDEPELLHALLEKLTDGLIGMIGQLNDMRGFDTDSHVTHCSYTYDREDPAEREEGSSENAWAYGMAQLFTSVSPRITEEFELAYVRRVFPYFKAVYYGCCERLDDRMEIIAAMPGVRKISCSPWSDREHFAEMMPETCVMSNKPSPALLAAESFDEDAVRRDIRRTIAAAKSAGRSVELILKDISTVRNRPERLWRWSRIAMEEALR